MFENLSKFDVILVSGPQRSGTTLAAKAIAADTGHTYVNEVEFNFHDEDKFGAIVDFGGKVVIHCPPMCHKLHEWADDEDVAVVMMRRDLRDIIASQERINWTDKEQWRELQKYNAKYGPIALVKYDYWERVQSPLIPIERRFEVEYESLAEHELWIAPEERPYFGHS